jgi:hypothetical protein
MKKKNGGGNPPADINPRQAFEGLVRIYDKVRKSGRKIPLGELMRAPLRGYRGKTPAELRFFLRRAREAMKVVLSWPLRHEEIDPVLWVKIFLGPGRSLVVDRIRALRWARALLKLAPEEMEYSRGFAVSIYPRAKRGFEVAFADLRKRAASDFAAALEYEEQRKHLLVLRDWVEERRESVSRKPQRGAKGSRQIPPPSEKEEGLIPEKGGKKQSAVSSRRSKPSLEGKKAAPANNKKKKARGGQLDLSGFSEDQLAELAKAGVPGASDELVARIKAKVS